MALVRKSEAGSAPGYHWPHPGAVVEVDDTLAHELLRIPGFTEVLPLSLTHRRRVRAPRDTQ